MYFLFVIIHHFDIAYFVQYIKGFKDNIHPNGLYFDLFNLGVIVDFYGDTASF